MKKIKIPAKKTTIEYEIKKSKFIAIAEPVSHREEVKNLVKEKRELYADSSHVVYAFFINDDRSISGLSDDGEPHGTAGRPVYEVLKGSGITDIIIIIIRYFGGTKLGTGGLVSAYGQAAKKVLEVLHLTEKIYTIDLKLKLNYKIYENIKKILIAENSEIIDEEFSTDILLSARIPLTRKSEIENKIRNLSRGEITPEYLD